MKKAILMGTLLAVLLLVVSAGTGWSQQEGSAAPSKPKIDINAGLIWKLLEFWRWPLLGCLVAGVLIVMVKVFRLLGDSSQGSKLRPQPLHRLEMQRIEELVKANPKGSLSGFLASLIQVYRTSPTLEAFGAEVQLFRQTMSDPIQSSRHWLAYLSATSGALGLLGTVWGVFITFYRGSFDQTQAVYGMGVALVTTGVGIIISLILDLGSAIVQTVGNRNLDISMQKVEEFRETFLRELNPGQRGAA